MGCSRAEKCGGWQEASGDLLRKTQEKTGEAKQEKREERGLLIAVERGGTRAEWFSGERIVSGIPRHRVERRFSGAAIAVFLYVFIFDISYISFSVISALFHFDISYIPFSVIFCSACWVAML